MELGPIQKQWIENLKNHPERQYKGGLGIKYPDGTYQACCLGELCLLTNRVTWSNNDKLLSSCYGTLYPTNNDAGELGLYSYQGSHRDSIDRDDLNTLADMNDGGKTWPEIADIVEANPEHYFNKSY